MAQLDSPQRPGRTVLHLSWPLIMFMLGQTVMGLVDTKLVGSLGAQALGGVGLATALLYAASIFMVGLMRGVKVCTGHALGSGRLGDSHRIAQVGLGLALLGGVVWTAALRQATPLLGALDVSPDLLPATREYLSGRLWGLPATFLVAALLEYRQGCGEVRSSMWVGLGGNLVNGVLAYGLIHGRFGLPAYGVWGAGLGTALAEWAQGLALGAYVWTTLRRSPPAAAGAPLPYLEALRQLVWVGLPTALQYEFEYLALALCTLMLAGMGEAEVAAHQIAVVINRIAYLPGVAVGEAACILVSGALGARNLAGADQWVRTCVQVAGLVMASIGALLLLTAGPMAALFSDDPAIIERTRRVLALAGLFQLVDSVNIVMRGALRGAKDVRVPALLGVGILWATIPPITYFFGRVLQWGVLGAWCSFVSATAICAVWFTWRWTRGRWRPALVAEFAREERERLAGGVAATTAA